MTYGISMESQDMGANCSISFYNCYIEESHLKTYHSQRKGTPVYHSIVLCGCSLS